METKKYRFDEVTINFDKKRIPLSSAQREKRQGTFRYYGAQGVIDHVDDYIFDGTYLLIAEDGENLKSKKQNIAQVVDGQFWVNNHAHIVQGNEQCDTRFLCYLINSMDLSGYVTGSAQPKLSQANLNAVTLSLPTLAEQKRIVEYLYMLDQKIDVNRQINDNLQQQLFSLYENMATASPCLKEYTLSNLCDFQEGYVNPPQTHPEYFDGEVKWLRAVDINESFIIETSRTLTKAGFESAKKSALLFEPNTIAISKSGTIGRLGIIADYMCGNRAVINIAPHDTNMLAFIYCFLKSKQREFPDMAVGSVQKNLYVSLLEPLSVSIPDNESLTAFNAVGASILGMIHNNCVENTDLANLRDTILPKLMSGEIDDSSVLL